MNETETGKILSSISEIYPAFRKGRNIQATGGTMGTVLIVPF